MNRAKCKRTTTGRTQDLSAITGLILTIDELIDRAEDCVLIFFPSATAVHVQQEKTITEPNVQSLLQSNEVHFLRSEDISDMSFFGTKEELDVISLKSLDTIAVIPAKLLPTTNNGIVLTFACKQDEDGYCDMKEGADILQKQLSITLSRLEKTKTHLEKFPNTVNQILHLCGSLFDQDAGELQKKVLNYLISNTNSETGFLLLVCLDSRELLCQVFGQIIQEDSINFDADDKGLFESVLNYRKVLNLGTLSEKESKDIEEIMKSCGQDFKVQNLLCVPVCHQISNEVIGMVCLINKTTGDRFTNSDVQIVRDCFKYTTSVLFTTIAFQRERRLKMQTEKMLAVAKNIFSRMGNLNDLLLMIMQEARNLTQAERCSVFLVDEDSNELVAKVFDGLPTASDKNEWVRLEDGTEIQQPGEIRIPKSQGIAGHVATTGQMLNIKKAYEHPLFYRGVDDETGFKTRNILCFPIQDDCGKTVGVAQLCNKIKGQFFTKIDEEIAKAFSIYCCISITHSLMYKKVEDAQHRSRLANELMMFHMKMSDEDISCLSTCKIPPVSKFLEDFESFSSIPRNVKDRDTTMACVSMFETLGLINRWRINRRTLSKFIFMVKRNYRDPPYHNWMHAFSVAHFIYICIRNMPLQEQLSELEILALFVASLCHDVDHRGTNNSFQVQSKSVLAALYSSEGSVLERHHFSQTVCILNTEGCNVFESLLQRDYIKVLDLIRDIILATDLAHHLQIFSKIDAMSQNGYNQMDKDHHNLLLCLLMTSADLSDQTKNWRNTRSVAELIYKEFFRQGDLEKAIGNQPCEQMDRERAVVPNLQIAFLDGIVSPLYRVLSRLYPVADCINHVIQRNRDNWKKISEKVANNEIKGNSEEIFRNKMVDDDYD